MAQSSLQPFSIGNVVTIAFQLYKNRFQPYFLLALKAYFWLLIPVYGLAKFWAILALISRLVYCELINQPETITGGKMYVDSKLWKFLFAAILLGFIALGVWIILAIVFIIVFGIVTGLFLSVYSGSVSSLQPGNLANTILVAIVFSISTVGSILILIRFFVFELPLALEDNINAISTIRRSWNITRSLGIHILLIYFLSFLITFPLLTLLGFFYSLIVGVDLSNYLIVYAMSALIFLGDIIYRLFQLLYCGIIDQKQIFNLLIAILSFCLSVG